MRFLPVGTRSVLWGVHAFWFHPVSVALAWRRLYGKWPDKREALAIFFHDTAYIFCGDMDGPEGKLHPARAAEWGWRVTKFFGGGFYSRLRVSSLIRGHSRSFCVLQGNMGTSDLCDPDKLSVLYDPAWFYWLRAVASGEIFEYRRREEDRRGEKYSSCWAWLQSYRRAIRARFSSRLKV